ncbi:MAG: winged helix DNA-binding domain-containing protein [Thaumarchaeota archaeon]|nr:winged helix DNA-binding domain-containing protein [Nitrososphaerota archaeon]
MENPAIVYRRLANQHISDLGIGVKRPEDALASMGAIQAQDYPAALWAIGLRCENSTQAGIEAAIAKKTIVRTWLMRGTLHFVASSDIRWMLRLLAPRLTAFSASRERQLGMSDDIVKKSEMLFAKALQGGGQLTRDQMYQVLKKGGIATTDTRGYHLLYRAASDGLICFGAHDGKRPRFTLLDEWIVRRKEISDDRALGELASRYFTSHGPATIKDYVWWSGLKVSDAKTGIEKASPPLVQEEIGGKTYYAPRSGQGSRIGALSVHLLPAFDEYLVGYSDRSAMLSDEKTQEMLRSGRITFTHSNGIFLPTIVIDGEVVGTWKRRDERGKATVTIQPFLKLDNEQMEGVRRAAERYGDFLGVPILLKENPAAPNPP